MRHAQKRGREMLKLKGRLYVAQNEAFFFFQREDGASFWANRWQNPPKFNRCTRRDWWARSLNYECEHQLYLLFGIVRDMTERRHYPPNVLGRDGKPVAKEFSSDLLEECEERRSARGLDL
jgi:hypothetical protein